MNYKDLYWAQMSAAKQRGIDWNLNYDEWINWWGEDISKRGKGKGKLCMARYGDEGPYELGNIYKSEYGANVKVAQRGRKQSKETIEKKRKNMLGKNNKVIRTPLGIFNTGREAAKAHNCDPSLITYRLKTNKDGYEYIDNT